jgi:hypothetical protein
MNHLAASRAVSRIATPRFTRRKPRGILIPRKRDNYPDIIRCAHRRKEKIAIDAERDNR